MFSPAEEIIDDYRQGKIVLLLDDEDRENEGDLMIAADLVTPEHVNFFARNACGLICLTITEERAQRLNLPLMVRHNSSPHETNFTVSIEAAQGVTTGISAADRATTVRTAVSHNATPDTIVMPGHIFPLVARPGGVLTRAGHTEAGCDLARLAGHEPASMIVEVMNSDGSMAKRPELEAFAQKHGIKLGTIADLIRYRALHDTTITLHDERRIGTGHGDFILRTYTDRVSDLVHYALIRGEIDEHEPCLVRVQVINTLRDLFAARRPDSAPSWSIHDALGHIGAAGQGVLVLVGSRESQAELLEQVNSFPDLPRAVGSRTGHRNYLVVGTGSQILRDVGVGKMRLLSSPSRYNAISGFNLEVVEFVEPDEV